MERNAQDARRTGRLVSDLGEWIGVFGAAAIVVSFSEADWVTGPGGRTYAELQKLGSDGSLSGLAKVYFGFAGWVVFGVVVLLCLIARYVRVRPRWASSGLAVLIALSAAGLGVAATRAATQVQELPDKIGPGLYLTVAGYALLAVAAVMPERRWERRG